MQLFPLWSPLFATGALVLSLEIAVGSCSLVLIMTSAAALGRTSGCDGVNGQVSKNGCRKACFFEAANVGYVEFFSADFPIILFWPLRSPKIKPPECHTHFEPNKICFGLQDLIITAVEL